MDSSRNVDMRDINFVLWEQLRAHEVLAKGTDEPPLRPWLTEMLADASDFAQARIAPTQRSADIEGCRLENGHVHVPAGFAEAWSHYVEAGWGGVGLPRASGGQGAPFVGAMAVNEIMAGANLAFMTYSAFAMGAYHLVRKFGDATLQRLFSSKLASNRWSACLCMTEPHAGTDVGAISTTATRRSDGTYLIHGAKSLISVGSADLVENHVYLLLARIEDAPSGTGGLSCFLVPRQRIAPDGSVGERNGVEYTRLVQKMGLRGSATADITLGKSEECIGYLLGNQHAGMTQLLTTMNQARLGTALFAFAVASRAYLHAAHYASQRLQGTHLRDMMNPSALRVPLTAHADVRRMLLEMKCKVEGCRALVYRVSLSHEQAMRLAARGDEVSLVQAARHETFVALFSPIAKAYASDQAWRVCELSIQVHGGRGYTNDFPVEQFARDVKVMSIWEGTNFVQSAELIVNRLGLGAQSPTLKLFVEEVRSILDANLPATLTPLREPLACALQSVVDTHAFFCNALQMHRMPVILLNATRFLQMIANVSLGWLLLDAAVIARTRLDEMPGDHPDAVYYDGKIQSARFFFANFLGTVSEDAIRILRADTSALDVDPEVFQQQTVFEDFVV